MKKELFVSTLDQDITRIREDLTRGINRDLIQILKRLATTVYGRVVLGLSGLLELVSSRMKTFLLNDEPKEEEVAEMIQLLELFADVVNDEDNSLYIAKTGVHKFLVRLMEHPDESIQEVAAQVVSNCTSSKFNVGICFPSKAKQLGSTERSYPLIIPLPTHANDTLESKDNTRAVLIRQVPTRMTGQPKTGYLLWGAARVLARWIHLNQDKFKYRTVLEVGSGLGLGGIVAAHYAKQITLTDYQADTLRALEYNLKLNGFDVSSNGSSDESQPVTSNVIVDFLDWDHLEDIEEHKKADIVIGCDIICEPSTAIGFLAVIRRHLKQNGVAYLLNANSHSRFGVIHLHDLLSKANDLCSTITPVHEMVQGNKLLETVHDAKELSYEYYEIRHFYQQ